MTDDTVCFAPLFIDRAIVVQRQWPAASGVLTGERQEQLVLNAVEQFLTVQTARSKVSCQLL